MSGGKSEVAPIERRAYRINDAAKICGIGRTTIYSMAKKGELTLIKIAGRSLVPDSEIRRLTSLCEPQNAA
jgi:excisionase family DNA binding protein